jgi:hypothetical protein
VRTLEYAKSIRGDYPHNLKDLEEWIPSVYFADLWDPSRVPGCRRTYPVYIRSTDGLSYELFGVGPDCVARTADDVHVNIGPHERDHVGLITLE